MTELRSGAVTVHAPASSANLGPAFDCAGLALDLWDTYTAEVTAERGVHVITTGEGAGEVPTDCSHAVAVAMKQGFDTLGVRPAGFTLTCVNRIPHARGLGSSAAAIIGGLVLARALVADGRSLTDQELLRVALTLESHPDNLSAALAGGLTVGWLGSAPGFLQLPVSPALPITLCIPSQPLMTREARSVLGENVTRSSAIFNIARAALLPHALNADPHLLMVATEDALHQQQRADMYPESIALLHTLRAAGMPAVISGAGPSVLVFADAAQVAPLAGGWAVKGSSIPSHGAWVEA
jgi:homoserine kinase